MTSEGLHALVLGGSGAIGKALLNEISNNAKFTQVTVIVRKNIEGLQHQKFLQKVVNFENLDDYKEIFVGAKVAYCCLGTTRGKAGVDGFVKVDRDYVYEAAKLLKDSGCSHFHLVTSKGANKNSSFLYMKTKGEVESMITDLKFPRFSIYRPSLLLCDREESRPLEKVAQIFAKGFDWRNKMSIPVETVAHAMVNNTFLEAQSNIEIFENNDINAVGID